MKNGRVINKKKKAFIVGEKTKIVIALDWREKNRKWVVSAMGHRDSGGLAYHCDNADRVFSQPHRFVLTFGDRPPFPGLLWRDSPTVG